jgi:hypothetical protein
MEVKSLSENLLYNNELRSAVEQCISFCFQVVAVPCPDMNQFKLKVDSVWRLPASVAYGVYGSDYAYESKSTIGKIDINWGTSGFNERNIKCKVRCHHLY